MKNLNGLIGNLT